MSCSGADRGGSAPCPQGRGMLRATGRRSPSFLGRVVVSGAFRACGGRLGFGLFLGRRLRLRPRLPLGRERRGVVEGPADPAREGAGVIGDGGREQDPVLHLAAGEGLEDGAALPEQGLHVIGGDPHRHAGPVAAGEHLAAHLPVRQPEHLGALHPGVSREGGFEPLHLLGGGLLPVHERRIARMEIRELTPDRWDDLVALFGANGACGGCWCLWWRIEKGDRWAAVKGATARRRMRAMVKGGRALGALAYVDGVPVGWVSYGPRKEYPRLDRAPSLRCD